MAGPNRVSDIARALTSGAWVPSADEQRLAQGFLARGRRLMEERMPADMPLRDRGEPWLTQVLVLEARLCDEVESELLPVWRDRLSGSPVLELVDAYRAGGAALVPHGKRLLAAWRTDPPAKPTAGDLAEEASRQGTADAAARVYGERVRRWEETVVPGRERVQHLDPALGRLSAVQAVLSAVGTGDISY